MNSSSIVHPYWLDGIASRFSDAATIQAVTETIGDHGEVTDAWADVAGMVDIPAAITTITTGKTENASLPMTVTIDAFSVMLKGFYPAITTKHRIVFWGDNHDIISRWHAPFNAFTMVIARIVE